MSERIDNAVVNYAEIIGIGQNDFTISWGSTIGFGQLHGQMDLETNRLVLRTEYMGADFVKKNMCQAY